MKIKTNILLLFFVLLVVTAVYSNNHLRAFAQETSSLSWPEMQQLILADRQVADNQTNTSEPTSILPCWNGSAGVYPCDNIDLLSQMPLNKMDADEGNDIWGWTDQSSGREFALIGMNNGVGFVEITDPTEPRYLGKLPTHSVNSIWRDIKVYQDHAFVVSEAAGHGLQIFDLTQLLNVASPPVTFDETNHSDQFGNAHNIAINEDSGFAYVVGANSCSGGLHMINIQTPTNPIFAGCFSEDGYTHDAQCVIYNGPDSNYQGSEICFNANEDTLTIADVTDKNNPVQLAREGYSGASYAHQGWLTEDQKYFLLGDEGDEASNGHNSRTYIWDVSDLVNPTLIGAYTADVPAIDHNLYIRDGLVFEANYRSGLRILDAALIPQGNLTEIAYFDTYPSSDTANFNGAWGLYPFFESGTIIVSDIESGLFVLKHIPRELQSNYLPMIRKAN